MTRHRARFPHYPRSAASRFDRRGKGAGMVRFQTEEFVMKFEVQGDTLTITIDVSKKARDAAPPSTSGKSNVLASTRGFTGISTPAGLVKLGLNVTT